ncbi:MAG TPA: hypothetical protein VK483_14215 [Chitinophagaceae bacterium]|nr:hypothetical protein [Chitinophagaceae bacterium]
MTRISTISPQAPKGSGKVQYSSYLYTTYGRHDSLFQYASTGDRAHEVYLQGRKDGVKDLQEEVIKMAKALFQIAQQKAEFITDRLVEAAEKNEITINKFCLRIESWEKISLLIIVKIEDYLDDKIESLYEAANQLSLEHNNEKFMWEYVITYSSENLSMEKIISEGYNLVYEPSTEPRKA